MIDEKELEGNRTCEQCGKPLAGRRKRFCSPECSKVFRDAARLKANGGHLCQYACTVCGKTLQLGRRPKTSAAEVAEAV